MDNKISVGIDAISFYSPHYFLDLKVLADKRGTNVDSYYKTVGQEKMAVPPPGEDIVTMGANAAVSIILTEEAAKIDMLLFATESGIDQSKAGGIYIHKLLGLPSRCRVLELKQACYSATAALQMSIPMIRQNPDKKVLIIASDVARYGFESPGEKTQGAGAVAMLISARPKLVDFDDETGFYTEDVMDFWRPNYLDEALVDGKSSIRIYIKSLLETWQQYHSRSGREFVEFSRFCYHLPFTRMAEKAHKSLARHATSGIPQSTLEEHINDGLHYNRLIGNSYAASLYISLASLLDKSKVNLDGKGIAFFSYGSGCMAEFFSGKIVPGYENHLKRDDHELMLSDRCEISYQQYAEFYNFTLSTDGGEYAIPNYQTGRFRLTALKKHQRCYEQVT